DICRRALKLWRYCMSTSTTNPWITGLAWLVLFVAVCYLVGIWFSAQTRRKQQREALYRKLGKEPPPPVSAWRFFLGISSMVPMLFMFCSRHWCGSVGASFFCLCPSSVLSLAERIPMIAQSDRIFRRETRAPESFRARHQNILSQM